MPEPDPCPCRGAPCGCPNHGHAGKRAGTRPAPTGARTAPSPCRGAPCGCPNHRWTPGKRAGTRPAPTGARTTTHAPVGAPLVGAPNGRQATGRHKVLPLQGARTTDPCPVGAPLVGARMAAQGPGRHKASPYRVPEPRPCPVGAPLVGARTNGQAGPGQAQGLPLQDARTTTHALVGAPLVGALSARTRPGARLGRHKACPYRVPESRPMPL